MTNWKNTIRAALVGTILAFSVQASADETVSDNTGALADMALGNADAPVTMIEYASVTCSHCADWNIKVYPEIYERYIKTGKIRLIVREFPLIPGHPALVPRSYAGTMLARCAADQNGAEGYFAVLKTLFAKQEEWAFGQDSRGELLKIAADAGIDDAGFEACIKREDIKDHLDRTMQTAQETFDISSTPSFIINGEKRKVYSVEDVAAAIDAAIAAAP